MGKTCFFIGHREAEDGLLPQLTSLVERHITEYGVDEFVVGHYGRFDSLAVAAVKTAKKKHPDVRLIYLRPYHPAERNRKTPEGFDSSFYPRGMEKVPQKVAIVKANQYMVDHSDYLIAHVWHPASNARKLLEYAQKRERRGLICVTNLGKPNVESMDLQPDNVEAEEFSSQGFTVSRINIKSEEAAKFLKQSIGQHITIQTGPLNLRQLSHLTLGKQFRKSTWRQRSAQAVPHQPSSCLPANWCARTVNPNFVPARKHSRGRMVPQKVCILRLLEIYSLWPVCLLQPPNI